MTDIANPARRQFLKQSLAASMLGMTAAGAPLPAQEPKTGGQRFAGKAQSVILIWLDGGAAHTETFDPKPYFVPKNVAEAKRVATLSQTIDTNVDHIKFAEGLEKLGQWMDKGALIRSFVPGTSDHDLGVYQWHTGYGFGLTVQPPNIGAAIGQILGPQADHIPAYFNIDQTAFNRVPLTSGFLGAQYMPFNIPLAQMAQQLSSTRLARKRHQQRQELFNKLSAAGTLDNSKEKQRLELAMDQAYRFVMSPDCNKAFDLASEPKESYDSYAKAGRFGLNCLLARRLVGLGARFVETVFPRNQKGSGDWDYHGVGLSYPVHMKAKRSLDLALSTLLQDLHDQQLLNHTLVIVASEFSRSGTMGKIDKKNKDKGINLDPMKSRFGNGHFGGAGSILLYGGGIKGGSLYGKTSPATPCPAIENQVGIEDVHATMYHALGIAPDYAFTVEQRPFYVTKDGKGKAITDILS